MKYNLVLIRHEKLTNHDQCNSVYLKQFNSDSLVGF